MTKSDEATAAEEAADWGVSEEEYAIASSLVEDALQGTGHLLSAAETVLLREDLLVHLFGSPEGQRALRAVMAGPRQDRAGDVPSEPGDVPVRALGRRGGIET